MTALETVLAAFGLASSGHPDEAKALLRGSPAALETEEGLDLLARIELSLGNEMEARRLWTLADNSQSCRALDALDSAEWRHRKMIFMTKMTILLASAIVIVRYFMRGLKLQ